MFKVFIFSQCPLRYISNIKGNVFPNKTIPKGFEDSFMSWSMQETLVSNYNISRNHIDRYQTESSSCQVMFLAGHEMGTFESQKQPGSAWGKEAVCVLKIDETATKTIEKIREIFGPIIIGEEDSDV